MAPTVEEVLELVFTTENPNTGSQPPEYISWVIFENGTVFLTSPDSELPLDVSMEKLIETAITEMKEMGPTIIGTPSGDFNANRLDGWYPDDSVFMVSFDHPGIAVIFISEEKDVQDITAGVLGRAQRDEDVNALKVRSVRHFNKTLKVF